MTGEAARLALIRRAGLLGHDTPPSVQRILQAMSADFQCDDCLVTIVGDRLQHIKAFTGNNIGVLAREDSFCTHTIQQPGVMVVEDTALDSRFRNNPCVLGPPHIAFYAGAPLRTATGEKLGAVCLISDKSRQFSGAQAAHLAEYADRIAIKLGLFDESRDVSIFDADDLGRLIMDAGAQGDSDRLTALVDAYYGKVSARPAPPFRPLRRG